MGRTRAVAVSREGWDGDKVPAPARVDGENARIYGWFARRPLAAAVALVCAAAVFLRVGLEPAGLLGAAFAVVVIAVATTDLEERRIPNSVILPAIVSLLVLELMIDADSVPKRLFVAVATGLFFLVPALFSARLVGMGDAKLGVLLGLALGSSVVPALFLASCAAAIVSLALIARHGRGQLQRHIPFGPFLAAGALVVVLAAPAGTL
jgi:prepilin signal peptidase PulO-like enzyme (type II secretory pathway)